MNELGFVNRVERRERVYSKDTIYFSRRSWKYFQSMVWGHIEPHVQIPGDVERMRYLAVEGEAARPYIRCYRVRGQMRSSKRNGVRHLASILRIFQDLKEVSLVIEGRDGMFQENERLVEAGDQYEDYYIQGGRSMYLNSIPDNSQRARVPASGLEGPSSQNQALSQWDSGAFVSEMGLPSSMLLHCYAGI
jgi:hypothetical protein